MAPEASSLIPNKELMRKSKGNRPRGYPWISSDSNPLRPMVSLTHPDSPQEQVLILNQQQQKN